MSLPATGSLRIIIADDDSESRGMYEYALQQLGHHTIATAENGAALLAQFDTAACDLILADINMPQLDGIAATKQIWKRRPVPIVLISGQYDAHLLDKAQLRHVMAFLVKPISLTALSDTIHLAVDRFAQYRAIEQQAKHELNISDDWRNVCRAKQMLFESANVDDGAAFLRLQDLAAATHETIAQAARSVIAAHNLAET